MNNGEDAIHRMDDCYLAFGDYGNAFYVYTSTIKDSNNILLYIDSVSPQYGLDSDGFNLNGKTKDVFMDPKEIEVFQLKER